MKSASEGSSHSLNSRSIQRRLTEESAQQTLSHHKDVFEKLPTGKAIEVNDVSATEECLVLPCIHQNDNNAAISTKGGLSIARETRPTRVSSDVSDVEASLNRGETDEWIEIEEHVTRSVRRNNWKEAIADLDKLFTDEELAMFRQSQQTDCRRQASDGSSDSAAEVTVRNVTDSCLASAKLETDRLGSV